MENCQNCNTPLIGKFCYACGQKVVEPRERTLTHFIYQFFGSAFFLENNFLKNLWNLLVKPGLIPLDFMEGRRKRWMPPFSLFLLLNLFYFWYSPLTDLNLSLREQLRQPHHKQWAPQLLERKLKSENMTLDEYGAIYNGKSPGYANSLVIIQIPILAFFLSLFYYRKKYFFADHFIYALYFFAFLLLLGLLQSAVLYLVVIFLDVDMTLTHKLLGYVFLTCILWYLFISLQKIYAQRKIHAALSIIPVLLMVAITHFLYRTILFLIIFIIT
jgi:hypothetical protein